MSSYSYATPSVFFHAQTPRIEINLIVKSMTQPFFSIVVLQNRLSNCYKIVVIFTNTNIKVSLYKQLNII